MRTSLSIFTAMFVSIFYQKDVEGAKLSEMLDTGAKVFLCQPNITYVHGFKTCVCTNNGQWPKNCSSFRKLYSDKVLKNRCKKNSYVPVHCNICKCNQKGQINYEKCTKHECETGDKSPKGRKFKETINGKCNPKLWYSFAPCQLCYCINDNKLICNPINDKMDTLVLGTYNFTVCGDMFLKDTIDLMPNSKNFIRLGNYNIEDQPINEIDNIKDAPPSDENNRYNINQPEIGESNVNLNSLRGRFNKENVDSNSDQTNDEDGSNNVGSRTQMPEYDKTVSNEVTGYTKKQKNEESYSEEADAVINTEPTVLSSNKHKVITETISPKNLLEYKYGTMDNNTEKNVFNLNLPNILRNIIKLSFRRAHVRKMVSLDSKSSCEPGTKMAVECNTCFCMRNGKLLCTMKLCLEDF